MRSDSGSADGRLVAGGVTLAILLVATFIAALIVSGVLSGNGSGADGIAIAGGTQTLEPDSDADVAADNAVTESDSPEPSPTETSDSSAMFALGDSGDGVRELQARLRQIHWYQTDVTGDFDETTLQAVEGFQARRGLDPTGEVDQETWDELVTMTSTPTEDEMHNRFEAGPTILGPGDEGDEVRELQARLKQIGWFDHEVTGAYGSITAAAVERFQTKRGIASTGEVDQNTWDHLVEMTRDPTGAELSGSPSEPTSPSEPPGPPEEPGPPEPTATASSLPEECLTGRVLCIDREERLLRWVVDGETVMTLNVRFGSEPVRDGEFKVNWKWEDPWREGVEYALYFDSGPIAVHYWSGSDPGESSVSVADKEAMAQLFRQVEQNDGVFVYRS